MSTWEALAQVKELLALAGADAGKLSLEQREGVPY